MKKLRSLVMLALLFTVSCTETSSAIDIDDSSNDPLVEEPSDDNSSGDESTDNPSGDEPTDNPSGDESTDNPSGDESTDNPSVDEPSDDDDSTTSGNSSISSVGRTYSLKYKEAIGADGSNELLYMTVMVPNGLAADERVPGIIFFHGGAFASGTRAAFDDHSYYLCSRGMVTINIEYRVGTSNKMTDALNDARTAVRFVRANADKFQLDPDRLASSGGSAGGCLAASITMSKDYLADTESDTAAGLNDYSFKSSAMLLLNPVLCNGDGTNSITSEKQDAYKGWGYSSLSGTLGTNWPNYSSMHRILLNATDGTETSPPPALYMVGDSDDLVPEAQAWEFKRLYEERWDQRCDTFVYDNCEHGFFNVQSNNATYFYHTLVAMDNFLVSLGYLDGEENLAEWLAVEYPAYTFEDSVSYKTSNN